MEAVIAAFGLGLVSAASPCLLPLYPGFIAYLAAASPSLGRRAWLLGLAVLAGLLTTTIALGVMVASLALPLGDVLRWSIPITTVVLVAIGGLLVLGRNPFERLAGTQVPVVRHPAGQAYLYGLLAGPVALPCAGPFLVALLAISVGLADGLSRVGTFVLYGLGFGLPLLALAAIGTSRAEGVARLLARHNRTILRLAGVGLIATAIIGFVGSGIP